MPSISIFLLFTFISLGKCQLTCDSVESISNAPFSLKGSFSPSLDCQWTIILQDDYYPLVKLNIQNISATDTVSLLGKEGRLQPNGKSEFILDTALLPVKGLFLNIKTGGSTQITVDANIVEKKANLSENPKEFPLNGGDQAVSLPLKTATAGETYAFSANSTGNVSFSLMAHPDPAESSKLMGFFIYEGEQLKGSLYQYQNKPYISEGNDVGIFIASGQTTAKSLLLIQNSDNIEGVSSFDTKWQYALDEKENPKEVVFQVTGGYKEPAILTVGRSDEDSTDCYLTEIEFSDSSSQVYVYAGTFADDYYKLERYDYSNLKTNLPQQLPGPLKTFVVYGKANITLVPNVTETTWNEAYIGRRGFLMTENYPFNRESHSNSMHLEQENSTERMQFVLDTPKGGENAYWYIRSNDSGKSGGITESASVIGTEFDVTLYVSSSGNSNIGALVTWSITEVPTTTTTTTMAPSTFSAEVTDASNETTTDWSQSTGNSTEESSTVSGTENGSFTSTKDPATTTPKSTVAATVSIAFLLFLVF